MNALAKLLIIFCVPMFVMCSNAQTRIYSQSASGDTSHSSEFSRAELDQLLAPIALYPDTVLSHILIAATYPLEVVQADRWARAHSRLSAEAALDAADDKDWNPSVKALAAFPEILHRMSDDLDWTQRLGDAFLADEEQVTSVIQDLRQKAYASGNLEKMEHVRAHRDERIIIIEPTVEREVYIPYYDSRVVYGGWWWPDYPPVYWHSPGNQVYVGGFYWGPRVTLGLGFYSTSFLWRQHQVVYIDRSYSRPYWSRPVTSLRIANCEGAHHWQHEPEHRRGVVYRNERIGERYGSHRTSTFVDRERRFEHNSEAARVTTRRFNEGEDHFDGRRDRGASSHNERNSHSEQLSGRLRGSQPSEPNRTDSFRTDASRTDTARTNALRDRLRTGGSAMPAREWGSGSRDSVERNAAQDASGRSDLGGRDANSGTPIVRGQRLIGPDRNSVDSNFESGRGQQGRTTDTRTNFRAPQEDGGTFSRRAPFGNHKDETSGVPERAASSRAENNATDSNRAQEAHKRIDSPSEERPQRDGGGEEGARHSLRDRLERR